MKNPALDEALNAVLAANRQLADVSIGEIEKKIKAHYPGASYAEVVAIVSEDYSEHGIEVYNKQGERLDEDDHWPLEAGESEDWFLTVTEGACGFDDAATVFIN